MNSKTEWPEMFCQIKIDELSKDMCVPADQINCLREDLFEVGFKIREIIDVTPSKFKSGPDHLSLSKRARLIDRNIIKLSNRLQSHLLDDSIFAEFPNNHASSLSADDRGALVGELERLTNFAIDLRDDLVFRSKQPNPQPNVEMRLEFLYWIALIVKNFAKGLPIERSYTGVKDSNDIDDEKSNGNASKFFQCVRTAYVEITGEKTSIDEHFKELVKMLR